MNFSFRVPDDMPVAWVLARYANKGDVVKRGQILFDLMSSDGVAWSVVAEGKSATGRIRQIEGRKAVRSRFNDMDSADDPRLLGDSDLIRNNLGLGDVYTSGQILCQIDDPEGNNVETSTTLRPKYSPGLAVRKREGRSPRVS